MNQAGVKLANMTSQLIIQWSRVIISFKLNFAIYLRVMKFLKKMIYSESPDQVL